MTACEYPAYTGCSTCNTCAQKTACDTCVQAIQPVVYQQPRQVFVVLPPQPQPVIEQEIIYQPQPTCGCKKCGCKKHAEAK